MNPMMIYMTVTEKLATKSTLGQLAGSAMDASRCGKMTLPQ